MNSDVKFHAIFGVKYHTVSLTRLIFFLCQTLPFIHLCMILQLPK